MAMILTALRIMQTGHFTTPLICDDADFNTALEMVKILVQHAAKVFSALPAEKETPTTSNPRMALFQALPPQFEKQTYIALATQLQISESTTNKWLMKFVSSNLLIKQAHGSYTKKES
jgi:nitrogenase subunit NifH